MRQSIFIALLGLALLTATDAGAVSPTALAHELLTEPYPRSQLPPGFSAARISVEKQADGQVTVVKVDLKLPSARHEGGDVYYYVCPDASSAASVFTAIRHASPTNQAGDFRWHRVPGRQRGSHLPSPMLQGSATATMGAGAFTFRAIALVVREGAVVVYVSLTHLYAKSVNPASADDQVNKTLMGSALAHLARVANGHPA